MKGQKITHVIHFELNGGKPRLKKDSSVFEDQVVEHEKKVKEPNTKPEKKSFEFLGWYDDKDFNNKYDFKTRITEDKTLYACWGHQINLSATVNGKYEFGAGYVGCKGVTNLFGMMSFTRPANKEVTIVCRPEEGYDFIGWVPKGKSASKKENIVSTELSYSFILEEPVNYNAELKKHS